ncbi:hypothetical protein BAU28_14160 [Bacillus paramycoides]|uniref:Uncharacterized protein n=1 Tax=Bacillus paramycoides TaxID=2026194 RepID=A0A1J9VRV9_9BACI|nr:hypothetical protein BAU28_14160 [Bacillus paramycoides]
MQLVNQFFLFNIQTFSPIINFLQIKRTVAFPKWKNYGSYRNLIYFQTVVLHNYQTNKMRNLKLMVMKRPPFL